MARILVVEDDPNLLEILRYNLRAAGHEVRTASTGEDALRLAREQPPELVLLDLMLPDMPGTRVCKQIKGDVATRAWHVVIIVSAKGEEIDRVVGFELGADDYVVKPFSVRELLLRVQACMRRAQAPERSRRHRPAARSGSIVTPTAYGSTAASSRSRRSSSGSSSRSTIDRTACRAATDSSRDVWGIELGLEPRTVDTHVKRLREKLGSAGKYVQTVRGVGYRFSVAPEE